MADPVTAATDSALSKVMKDISANPTLAGAETAIESGILSVAGAAAAATPNPLDDLAVQLFGSTVIKAIVEAIFSLLTHIGAAVPAELAAVKAKIDEVTHGAL